MATPPPETRGLETATVLRKSLRRLAIATTVLYLVLIAGGLKVYFDARNTTRALCTLRDDLTRRVQASTQFLKDHPNGIEGITPKLVLDGIANQTRTIKSLEGLSCDTIPKLPPLPPTNP